MVLCRLCHDQPAIKQSHVTPKLVYRAIKADSPTGFFRNPNNPNVRIQDGDNFELLCKVCEGRFGKAECQFNNEIFSSFHCEDRDHFEYGPWLHYFMTSLAWRTLVLDLPGLQLDPKNPKPIVAELLEAEVTMRNYLLGADHLSKCLHNHAIVWVGGYVASPELAAVGPNVVIRRSVFGYTVCDRKHGYSAIIHNLAGFMCFSIIKGNPRDTWKRTKINPQGGSIEQPQNVSSWLIGELLGCVVEAGRNQKRISVVQHEKVAAATSQNPTAAAFRFQELDKNIKVTNR